MGFFSRKKDVTPKQENPEFLAVVAKWDVFLDRIKTRFLDSLVDAEEALLSNLEESDYDIQPTMTAWAGIKSQLMALGEKIDTTFDEKVKPQMLQYKEHFDLLDQRAKGAFLREKIILKGLRRFEIVLEGKISTRFYNHAVKFLNEDFYCTQCSAKIEVRKDLFRAHYVSCDYCNTVNTFTPNDKISQIRWVVDNIAKFQAIEEWDAKIKAENELNEMPTWSRNMDITPHRVALEKQENADKAFWLKYFTVRAMFLPEYQKTIEHDIAVKMRWFYEDRKREYNF